MYKTLKRRIRRNIVRAHLESFLRPHATEELVLDLGCGDSRYRHFFPKRIAVDHIKQDGVMIVADAHRLPFPDASFRLVTTTETLEHMKEPQRVVDEIKRVLQPEGKVILTTRFLFPIHEAPHDFYRFTKYGLAHLFRSWESVQINAETKPFEGIAVLLQRIAYQADLRGRKVAVYGCLLFAKLVALLDALVVKEYGDIKRSRRETEIITSGYYVIAQKP